MFLHQTPEVKFINQWKLILDFRKRQTTKQVPAEGTLSAAGCFLDVLIPVDLSAMSHRSNAVEVWIADWWLQTVH